MVHIILNVLGIFFWMSFISIFWIFLGYPLSLWLFVRIINRNVNENYVSLNNPPLVTIIVPTYNESLVIEKKIENIDELDYPKDKLEIIVVDSASTDETVDKVQKYTPRVRLITLASKRGKARAINYVLPLTKGEIIVITDANAFMSRNTIKDVMKSFNNPKIGGATGAMRQINRSGNNISRGGEFYWKLEVFMRLREAALRSVIGMSGEISAFHRNIFVDKNGKVVDWYKPGGTDDFEMTLWIITHGLRVEYIPSAYVWEYAPDNLADLFKQKVRIIVQTIISIKRNLKIITGTGIYGFYIFTSRKVLPLFSPIFLIIIFLISALFSFNSFFWLLIFLIQVLFYLLASLSFNILKNFRIANFAQFFVLLNATVFIAWIEYLNGKDYTHWETVKSTRQI